MVVYRIYYFMVDRASKNVSTMWKVLHLWTQLMAAGSGILSAWYFYIVLQAFEHNCPLYAKMDFSRVKPNIEYNMLPRNVTINARESTWGRDIYCQYCFTIFVCSFIAGLVLATFFFWSKVGGAGIHRDSFIQPWKHVLPTLLVSICFMINVCVATYLSVVGFDIFCKEFESYIDQDRCNSKIDAFSYPFVGRIVNIHKSIIMVRSCGPICVISWIAHTAVLFIRICISPDFDVQIIKITNIKKSERERGTPMSNLRQLPSSFVGFKGSLPSLHSVFATQMTHPSAVQFAEPETYKAPEKVAKEGRPLRSNKFKSESSEQMEDKASFQTVSSDTNLIVPNVRKESRKIVQLTEEDPKIIPTIAAVNTIVALQKPSIKESTARENTVINRMEVQPKQTRFADEQWAHPSENNFSSGQDNRPLSFPKTEEDLEPKELPESPLKEEKPKPKLDEVPPKPEVETPTSVQEIMKDEEANQGLDSLPDKNEPTTSPETLLALEEQRIQPPPGTPSGSTNESLRRDDLIQKSMSRNKWDPTPPPFVDDKPGRLTSYIGRASSNYPQTPQTNNVFQGILPINYRTSLMVASSASTSSEDISNTPTANTRERSDRQVNNAEVTEGRRIRDAADQRQSRRRSRRRNDPSRERRS